MTEAESHRQKSDDLLRRAMKAKDLSERSTLITQAVHFHELALEADRLAAEQRRDAATVVPFHPSAGNPA